jgi:hypothetical protein
VFSIPRRQWKRSKSARCVIPTKYFDSREVVLQLRPVREGMGRRGRADAVGGVMPVGSPFVGPSGAFRQDLRGVDPVSAAAVLPPDGPLIGLRRDHVVGVAAEQVRQRVTVPEDDVQRKPAEPDGTSVGALAPERLADPCLGRTLGRHGGVQALVEMAYGFFLGLQVHG